MPSAIQTEFPYASLDFPGRTTVQVAEIATRLGYSVQHICNQIEEGKLVACNHAGAGASRASLRIPIEEYRAWILRSLTGPSSASRAFLDSLPRPLLLGLLEDINRIVAA